MKEEQYIQLLQFVKSCERSPVRILTFNAQTMWALEKYRINKFSGSDYELYITVTDNNWMYISPRTEFLHLLDESASPISGWKGDHLTVGIDNEDGVYRIHQTTYLPTNNPNKYKMNHITCDVLQEDFGKIPDARCVEIINLGSSKKKVKTRVMSDRIPNEYTGYLKAILDAKMQNATCSPQTGGNGSCWSHDFHVVQFVDGMRYMLEEKGIRQVQIFYNEQNNKAICHLQSDDEVRVMLLNECSLPKANSKILEAVNTWKLPTVPHHY